MTGFILFAISIAFVLTGVVIYAKVSKQKPDKQTQKEWYIFAGAPIAVGLVLSLFAANAKADDINYKWFEETTVFAGLDIHQAGMGNINPVCAQDGSGDNLNSHGGIRQSIISADGFALSGTYTHHSCAVNDDLLVYDSIGIVGSYTINWGEVLSW